MPSSVPLANRPATSGKIASTPVTSYRHRPGAAPGVGRLRGYSRRVVLLSGENRAMPWRKPPAIAAGVPVDVVPIRQARAEEALLEQMLLPAEVNRRAVRTAPGRLLDVAQGRCCTSTGTTPMWGPAGDAGGRQGRLCLQDLTKPGFTPTGADRRGMACQRTTRRWASPWCAAGRASSEGVGQQQYCRRCGSSRLRPTLPAPPASPQPGRVQELRQHPQQRLRLSAQQMKLIPKRVTWARASPWWGRRELALATSAPRLRRRCRSIWSPSSRCGPAVVCVDRRAAWRWAASYSQIDLARRPPSRRRCWRARRVRRCLLR